MYIVIQTRPACENHVVHENPLRLHDMLPELLPELLKTDIIFSVFSEEQEGQEGDSVACTDTSSSNSDPHSLHRYSYSGICYSPVSCPIMTVTRSNTPAPAVLRRIDALTGRH